MKRLGPLCILFLCLSQTATGQLTGPPAKATHKVENPKALTSFFAALQASHSGQRLEPVRIMQFGDSHTAADILTAQIRRRFQSDFGDGGAGFLVPRNPMSTRRRGVSSGATSGWLIEGIGGRIAADNIYAPAGIALATNQADETVWLQAVANHFEVYYVAQPGGGSIDIQVDGVSVLDTPILLTARVPRLGSFFYDEPALINHRLEVRSLTTGKVRLLGIASEQLNPGVVFDVFGINGARVSRLLGWNPAAFSSVVAKREPNLTIIAFGTNEAGDSDWTPLAYEQLLRRVLRLVRAAAPQASLLVMAPPDRGDLALASRRMPFVVGAERRAAIAEGAAFWSAFDAMGGPGSMNAWLARGLAQADHVHLSSAGYVRLADLFYEDMMKAYEDATLMNRR
jgi:lysophospholipase L1-like esterase